MGLSFTLCFLFFRPFSLSDVCHAAASEEGLVASSFLLHPLFVAPNFWFPCHAFTSSLSICRAGRRLDCVIARGHAEEGLPLGQIRDGEMAQASAEA